MANYIVIKQNVNGCRLLRKLLDVVEMKNMAGKSGEQQQYLLEGALEFLCNLFGLSENEQILEQVLS